jgi:hypothetical protein
MYKWADGVSTPTPPGHWNSIATGCVSGAAVLSPLLPARAAEFDAKKEEAAISRLYGGIHYRSDIETGKEHGKRIGGYTVNFARQDGAE